MHILFESQMAMKVFQFVFMNQIQCFLFYFEKKTSLSVEYLITLLTFQRFQILLKPRMIPVWDFVVAIFARNAMFNMGWVLSILSCQYLYSKIE